MNLRVPFNFNNYQLMANLVSSITPFVYTPLHYYFETIPDMLLFIKISICKYTP